MEVYKLPQKKNRGYKLFKMMEHEHTIMLVSLFMFIFFFFFFLGYFTHTTVNTYFQFIECFAKVKIARSTTAYLRIDSCKQINQPCLLRICISNICRYTESIITSQTD